MPYTWISEELFDNVPIAICVVDRDSHIVEANESFARWYGDWRGRPCYQVYKGRSMMCTSCGAAKTFADGKIREREEEGVDRRGRVTNYIVRIIPVVRENGDIPYVFEMSSDITEFKKLERQKVEAERLAAVGQTVAGLAHGIKNLIMGLEGGMYVVNSGLRGGNEERLLHLHELLLDQGFWEGNRARAPHHPQDLTGARRKGVIRVDRKEGLGVSARVPTRGPSPAQPGGSGRLAVRGG
ncbi:PAS domain-containing protein [bacterium]|nr:PAS domain-containing protein [bacterium]